MTSSSNFFDADFFLLSSLVNGQSFMPIPLLVSFSFIRDWRKIWKSEIPLSNIWRLWWDRDTKFDTNISNEMLLNAAKCQGSTFYCFCVIKGKPTDGGESKITPTQIRVKYLQLELKKMLFRHKLKSLKDNHLFYELFKAFLRLCLWRQQDIRGLGLFIYNSEDCTKGWNIQTLSCIYTLF